LHSHPSSRKVCADAALLTELKMKKFVMGMASVFALSLALGGAAVAKDAVQEKWSLSGFSHPESVDYDIPHKVFYVTNIGGAPLDKDGNGFISKVSRNGKLLQLKWIEGGLNAPKGIVMQGFKMWVTDIDRVHEIDTRLGKITNTFAADGAVFLNDPAVDKAGNVYVTDIAKRTIWKLENGKMAIWLQGDDLPHMNGLRVIYGGKLLVAGWGKGMHDDGSTDQPGHLFTVDLATKAIMDLGDGSAVGNLDGLERGTHGSYLATDFVAGGLYRIWPNGKSEMLLDLKPGSADLDTVNKGRMAVVPRMLEDTVTAYTVK
jgi:hypothetical protein